MPFLRPLMLLIFCSGFVALAYQILWVRQLGLIFGNSAHATAMTLGVFFGGLAVGSWFWGQRSNRLVSPLRTYAWLEFGIGGAGLLCLPVLYLYRAIYPALYGQFAAEGLWLVKGMLAVILVFPSAFLMGGTLPVMGKILIRQQSAFGATSAAMLGINTFGAAFGTFAAAFLMLPALGFRLTCILAVTISLGIAFYALFLSRSPQEGRASVQSHKNRKGGKKAAKKAEAAAAPRWIILLLAFVSGFNVLALEVLWTRMLAQVHENSVYSFAAVLIVVLLCLAAGAGLSSWWAASSRKPMPGLLALTAAGGLAVVIVPYSFVELTGGLQMLAIPGSFTVYMLVLFATALGAIGPSCLVLGMIFPFLMKGEERFASQPGRSIGHLVAINTIGAILGSLICGFLLLEWLNLWRSMQVLAALYLLMAFLIPSHGSVFALTVKGAAGVLLISTFTWMDFSRFPVSGFDPQGQKEEVIEIWEASDCTVTVVRDEIGEYRIRINSNYSLGSSKAYMSQIFQTRVPMLAWPDRKSVFYLGMGTGMTAGEALDRRDFAQVERVVVTELSPSVVEAAHKYFGGHEGAPDLCNGLFSDPRAEILVADGRNHLMADDETYDMINADLFLPYRSGSGSLYSLEHFKTVHERLNPGGLFVQWLPLYQLSEREFGIIARTLLEVFETVTLWRLDFRPGSDTVALIGHRDSTPLPESSLDSSRQQRDAIAGMNEFDIMRIMLPINSKTIPLFYCGNLSGMREYFTDNPLNTDDRPLIEYGTPRSMHRIGPGENPKFVGEKFADLVDKLLEATPPDQDPVLAQRSPANRRLPLAGASWYRAGMAMDRRDPDSLRKHWQDFRRLWLESAILAEENVAAPE
jgi:spermidine synthase